LKVVTPGRCSGLMSLFPSWFSGGLFCSGLGCRFPSWVAGLVFRAGGAPPERQRWPNARQGVPAPPVGTVGSFRDGCPPAPPCRTIRSVRDGHPRATCRNGSDASGTTSPRHPPGRYGRVRRRAGMMAQLAVARMRSGVVFSRRELAVAAAIPFFSSPLQGDGLGGYVPLLSCSWLGKAVA